MVEAINNSIKIINNWMNSIGALFEQIFTQQHNIVQQIMML